MVAVVPLLPVPFAPALERRDHDLVLEAPVALVAQGEQPRFPDESGQLSDLGGVADWLLQRQIGPLRVSLGTT